MKPNMFETFRTFWKNNSRYLEKNWEFPETYLGVFSWCFYLGVREGTFDHLPTILCEILNFQNAISFEWMVKFQFFFSILASLWWFLSETIMRYPLILKARFGGNFVRSFSRQKYQNLKNKKHTILGNSEFKIVANFQVNCVKTKKDEWKWAFLMSHMPTVLVKLFWTFGI